MGYGLAYRNSEPCGDEQKIVFICRLQSARVIPVQSCNWIVYLSIYFYFFSFRSHIVSILVYLYFLLTSFNCY